MSKNLFSKKQKMLTLKSFKNIPTCFTFLSDGRLACSSMDSTIKIFNLKTFEIDLNLTENKRCVSYITKIKSDHLVSCSFAIIRIYKINKNSYEIIQELKEHKSFVFKIIEIKKGNLISCSKDNSIRIYKKNENNNNLYTNIKTITLHKRIYNILEINPNIVVNTIYGESLMFWDFTRNRKFLAKINNLILCGWNKTLCKINEELLFAGGANCVYIIDIKNYKKIGLINGIQGALAIYKMNNNNILIGNYNGNIYEMKYENNKFELIGRVQAFKERIYDIIERNNTIFISATDKLFSVWN
jgi:WD40 repeat protein